MATATGRNGTPNSGDDVWDMTVPSAGGSGDYVACPAGNHPGTIVGVFDVGHQDGTDMAGSAVLQRKLILVFELAKKRPDGKPFILPREYTWSMSEKANFYKDVVNITGVQFREGDKFNPLSLLGQAVMISVKHTGSGEKVYHNVSAVAQFPEGFPSPEPMFRPLSWSVLTGQPFPADTEWLPYVYGQTIEAKAEQSRESRTRSGAGQAPRPVPAATSDDPDCPF